MPYAAWIYHTTISQDWSPLNYGTRIRLDIQVFFTVLQIIASIVVLALTRSEQLHVPLKIWIIGYLTGCAATLPLIWCYYSLQRQASQILESIRVLVDCCKWVLYCFFFAWFVIGWVWITKGDSTRSEAPSLYWLSFALLVFCAVEYLLWILVSSYACCCIPNTTIIRYIPETEA